jgi:hypothetical protein
VDVSLAIQNGDGTEPLRALSDWLRRQPELLGQVAIASRPPRPGEMGSIPELVTVAVGSGGAVSVLASSLRMWLAQPRRSDVKLTLRLPDGRVVELDARRVGDVEALLRVVLDSQPPPGP